MTRDKNLRTKLIRLGQILRIFMEKERVSSAWLSVPLKTTCKIYLISLKLSLATALAFLRRTIP